MIEHPKPSMMTSDVSMFHDVIPFPVQISVHVLLLASNLLPVLIFFKSSEHTLRSTAEVAWKTDNPGERPSLLYDLIDCIALYCSMAEVTCSTFSILFLFASRYHEVHSQIGKQTCLAFQLITTASQLFKTVLVAFINFLLINACLRRLLQGKTIHIHPTRAARDPKKTILALTIILISTLCSIVTSCLQMSSDPSDSALYCPNQILQTSTDNLFFWSFMFFNLLTFVTFLSSLLFVALLILLERRHYPEDLRVLDSESSSNFSLSAALIFSSLHHLFWMPVIVLIMIIHYGVEVSRFSCESAFFVAQMSSLLHPLVFILYLDKFKQEAVRTIFHLSELFLGCPGNGDEDEDEEAKEGGTYQKQLLPIESLSSISHSSINRTLHRLKPNSDQSLKCSVNPSDVMSENDVINDMNDDDVSFNFEENSDFWFNLAEDESLGDN